MGFEDWDKDCRLKPVVDVEKLQEKANIAYKKFRSDLFDYADEDEYKCPVEKEYVTTDYCESFCMGEGCKHIKTCQAYLRFKKKEENAKQTLSEGSKERT